ncbi:hypothetical protein QBC32DRAFT_34545 [Pseudoneurospora amorphoporcata]|uniref:Uncharacterized protein n=1 Tax=Pseudoneurospora amorphoporcata TaxID=241081 RepID=A0AAN6P0M4_9PEZI|nr:hypothetical protein QBC32DRAFT_34545 [Pseudoneurospora amorphoporcata]
MGTDSYLVFCIPHNRAPLTVVKRNQLNMGFRTHTLPALIGLWLLNIMRFMEPATQTLIIISMWVDVMAFIDIRAVASHVAGESYSENEWGFGQTITVTGWLPMVVQFDRAWRCECSYSPRVLCFTSSDLDDDKLIYSIRFSCLAAIIQNLHGIRHWLRRSSKKRLLFNPATIGLFIGGFLAAWNYLDEENSTQTMWYSILVGGSLVFFFFFFFFF